MIYLAYFIFIFSFVRLAVVLLNAGQWLRKRNIEDQPRISVLIPARNEEENIGILMADLAEMDYDNIEVIVYDDLSDDRTASIVKSFTAGNARIQLVRGTGLPDGWKGKNHACFQLARRAKGEFLLFLDADVRLGKGLFKSAVANMVKNKNDLLSIFPVQIMRTLAERITVPLMNWILVSLLPLLLVRKSSMPSLAAANGQFMMFRAEVYLREQFHQTLQNVPVEDIAIARFMKSRNYRVQTLLGNDEIRCHMYRGWKEAIHGFARSTLSFFGESKFLAIGFAVLTTMGFLPVIWFLSLKYMMLYFMTLILMKVFISLWSRQNVLFNLLLAPIQQITFVYILAVALMQQYKKAGYWKGRLIYQ
jgi:glycosyltransferase involved in cell wall biosynthesis